MEMTKFRLWGEDGFNYVFEASVTNKEVRKAIEYVTENVDDYDNEDVIERLRELGATVNVLEDDIKEENSFQW